MARQPPASSQSSTYIIAAVVFVVVVVASYLLISRLGIGMPSTSFSSFKNSFDSAPRVAIYAGAYNSTLGMTGTCADKLITSIIVNAHRNSSTIDYFIVSPNNCTYARNLGTQSFNSITTTVADCLNISKAEPTVYINYSATNATTIKPNYLYTSGSALFLSECGIATELS